MELKTKNRLKTEAKWAAIVDDYRRMMRPGVMKGPLYARLGKKYRMHPQSVARIVRKEVVL